MVNDKRSLGFIAFLGFTVGFVFAALIPLLLTSAFAFLGHFGDALSFLEASLILGVIGGIVSAVVILVMYVIWRAIPRNVQLLLIALGLVLGLLLVQPELDLLALLGLVLTALGVRSTQGGR